MLSYSTGEDFLGFSRNTSHKEKKWSRLHWIKHEAAINDAVVRRGCAANAYKRFCYFRILRPDDSFP
jgi:hypothetical protein